MDKLTSQEEPGMGIKGTMVDRDLRAFAEHFSAAPGYHKDVLSNLLEDTNEDTVLRILAHFNENLKEGCAKLNQAISADNCEIVWKTTHKLAGSAELLGFMDFAGEARELSRVVRANPVFENHLEEVSKFLKKTTELTAEISATCPGLNSFL